MEINGPRIDFKVPPIDILLIFLIYPIYLAACDPNHHVTFPQAINMMGRIASGKIDRIDRKIRGALNCYPEYLRLKN